MGSCDIATFGDCERENAPPPATLRQILGVARFSREKGVAKRLATSCDSCDKSLEGRARDEELALAAPWMERCAVVDEQLEYALDVFARMRSLFGPRR